MQLNEDKVIVTSTEDVAEDITMSEVIVPEGGTAISHEALKDRELTNQHPITAIEGLRAELDAIQMLKTVWTDGRGFAEYHLWADGNPILGDGKRENRLGYFVSLVGDTDRIQICKSAEEDVFGVIISEDMAGMIGGKLPSNSDGTEADMSQYGLVCIIGSAKVRRESSVSVGDFVVPNALGMAHTTSTEKVEAPYWENIDIQADVEAYALRHVPTATPTAYVWNADGSLGTQVIIGNEATGKEIALDGSMITVDLGEDGYQAGDRLYFTYSYETSRGAGYRVTEVHATDGLDFALINLIPNGNALARLKDELNNLSDSLSAVASNVILAMNRANDAYAAISLLTDGGLDSELMDDIRDAIEKSESVGDLQDKVDQMDQTIKDLQDTVDEALGEAGSDSKEACDTAKEALTQIEELKSQADKITEWTDPTTGNKGWDYLVQHMDDGLATTTEIKEVQTDMEEANTAISTNAKRLQSIASTVRKYSVGERSLAYDLTHAQAKSCLSVGAVYVPTVEHPETYKGAEEGGDQSQTFVLYYSYTWDGDSWQQAESEDVTFFGAYVNGDEKVQPYWYLNGAKDVIYNDITYEKETLYLWRDHQWIAVASLAENSMGRTISMVTQTSNEISSTVTGLSGNVSKIEQAIGEDGSVIKELTSWKEDADDALTYVKQKSDKNEASIMNLAKYGYEVASYRALDTAPTVGPFYAIKPEWDNTNQCWNWTKSGESSDVVGVVNETDYCYAANTSNTKTYYQYICDTDNKWTAIEIGRAESLAALQQKADENGAYIGMIVKDGAIDAGVIIEAINKNSTATIKANKVAINADDLDISLEGYVTIESLSGKGTSTIDGSNIKTGTIDAERIDTDSLSTEDLSAWSAQIAGWKINANSISKGSVRLHTGREEYDSLANIDSDGSPMLSPMRISAGIAAVAERIKEVCIDVTPDTLPFTVEHEIESDYKHITDVSVVVRECRDPDTGLHVVEGSVRWDGTFIYADLAITNPNTQYMGMDFVLDIEYTPAEASFKVLDDGSLYASAADIKGHIHTSSGEIGGWNIDTDKLYADGNNVGLSSGTDQTYDSLISEGTSPVRFYARGASEETVSMEIVITSAGPWTVSHTFDCDSIEIVSEAWEKNWIPEEYSTAIEGSTLTLTANEGHYQDVDRFVYLPTVRKIEYPFMVLDDGSLYANAASIKGNIQTTSGNIGGWNITENRLSADGEKVGLFSGTKWTSDSLVSKGAVSPMRFYAGVWTEESIVISVELNNQGNGETLHTFNDCDSIELVEGYWKEDGEPEWHAIQTNGNTLIVTGISPDRPNSKMYYACTVRKWNSNFKVLKDGSLYASAANIEGNINATSGTVGGWTINKDYGIYHMYMAPDTLQDISVGLLPYNAEGNNDKLAFYAGGLNGPMGGNGIYESPLRIYYDGHLYAKDAEIEGRLVAPTGNIGGWTIEHNMLFQQYGDGSIIAGLSTAPTPTAVSIVNTEYETVDQSLLISLDADGNGAASYTFECTKIELVSGGWPDRGDVPESYSAYVTNDNTLAISVTHPDRASSTIEYRARVKLCSNQSPIRFFAGTPGLKTYTIDVAKLKGKNTATQEIEDIMNRPIEGNQSVKYIIDIEQTGGRIVAAGFESFETFDGAIVYDFEISADGSQIILTLTNENSGDGYDTVLSGVLYYQYSPISESNFLVLEDGSIYTTNLSVDGTIFTNQITADTINSKYLVADYIVSKSMTSDAFRSTGGLVMKENSLQYQQTGLQFGDDDTLVYSYKAKMTTYDYPVGELFAHAYCIKISLGGNLLYDKTFRLFYKTKRNGDHGTKVSLTIPAGDGSGSVYTGNWPLTEWWLIADDGEYVDEIEFTQTRATENISVFGNLRPATSGAYSLGDKDHKWAHCYYNTSPIDTSDKNEKNNIEPLSEPYSLLFDKLEPVTYKLNSGESNRRHVGLIAQHVKEALDDVGIDSQDFAGYCSWVKQDGELGYGLRYSEFIPINIYEIQKLKARVAELENKIALLTEQGEKGE